MFSEYAPFSWVAIGFVGLFFYAVCVALYGFGMSRAVKSKYDAKFMQETGGVDPLSKVFEDKRIYLNDFVLPSSPVIDSKTFVGCEIVGPANIYMTEDYRISDIRPGLVDAVVLEGKNHFNNGYIFRNCTFRGCTFQRVTLFFLPDAAISHSNLDWLNWITPMPAQASLQFEEQPSQIEDQSDQQQKETEEEKQR